MPSFSIFYQKVHPPVNLLGLPYKLGTHDTIMFKMPDTSRSGDSQIEWTREENIDQSRFIQNSEISNLEADLKSMFLASLLHEFPRPLHLAETPRVGITNPKSPTTPDILTISPGLHIFHPFDSSFTIFRTFHDKK